MFYLASYKSMKPPPICNTHLAFMRVPVIKVCSVTDRFYNIMLSQLSLIYLMLSWKSCESPLNESMSQTFKKSTLFLCTGTGNYASTLLSDVPFLIHFFGAKVLNTKMVLTAKILFQSPN